MLEIPGGFWLRAGIGVVRSDVLTFCISGPGKKIRRN